MGIKNKFAQFREYKNGIQHCTFNPNGPGVVRIHLVPPKFSLFKNSAYIVILNGYYILPIGYSWALILSTFMKEVNKYHGKPITEKDENNIFNITTKKIKAIYPTIPLSEIEEDLSEIVDVLFTVARGETPQTPIEKLSVRDYAPNMTAPHRFDLMVSAMTDENGAWKCNQRCRFCYAAGQEKSCSTELSTQEWENVIDILYKAGVPMVTFTGGEPTLREDLPQLVKHAEKMVTRLNTNGVNLTAQLCSELASAGLDSVQVTLYSSDESIHNCLVGCEHFSDTVSGIKNALEAGLDVSVNTPLCKTNSDYLTTLEFINALGVRFVTVSGLICTGTAQTTHNDFDLSEAELSDIIKNAKNYCNENGMEIDFTSPGLLKPDFLERLKMNVPMCGACLSNMAVSPDGTVVPCQSWLNSSASLGNVLTDDFKAIWSNPRCVSIRNMSNEQALSCPFRTQREGKF
ncbi:MAG: radical SAM protein [Ruminococcaceae bacterium]|nr:radical SAM protein [Oscillospiraceae bacterium]